MMVCAAVIMVSAAIFVRNVAAQTMIAALVAGMAESGGGHGADRRVAAG